MICCMTINKTIFFHPLNFSKNYGKIKAKKIKNNYIPKTKSS